MKLAEYIQDQRPGATASELALLAELVSEVPSEIRAFLAASNGGVVRSRDLAVLTPWGPRHIIIREFWPITDKPRVGGSIHQATLALRGENMLPPTALAVATDIGSSCLCISTEPESLGAIYLWDDTRSHPQLPRREKVADFAEFMTPIASSLSELAAMLTDETTALEQLSRMPSAGDGSAVEKQQQPDGPKWIAPSALTKSQTDCQVFVYRHVAAQPDVVYSKPLEAARSNTALPLASEWDPPLVKWFRPDTNTVDLIDANGLLLLRESAVKRCASVLEPYGEFLRCETDSDPLFVFRCLTVVDALDPGVELVPGKNGFVDIKDVSLLPEAVKDAAVFTVPEQPRDAKLFLTRPTVDALLETGIRALDFTLLWEE